MADGEAATESKPVESILVDEVVEDSGIGYIRGLSDKNNNVQK